MSLDLQQQIDEIASLLERLRKSDVGGVVVAYTPTYDGAVSGNTTYTVQVGSYVRLGPIMIAAGIVVWTAATGTGNARITLPDTAVNTTNLDYGGSLSLSGVTFTNSTPTPELIFNNSFFQMRSPLTNAAGALVQVEAAGTLIFTITYFVG